MNGAALESRSESASKILIVDADPYIRRVVRAHLGACFRCDFEEAESTDEAMRKLEENEVRLVVCDLPMVERSGLRVIRHLKGCASRKTFFVLVPDRATQVTKHNLLIAMEEPSLRDLVEAIEHLGIPQC